MWAPTLADSVGDPNGPYSEEPGLEHALIEGKDPTQPTKVIKLRMKQSHGPQVLHGLIKLGVESAALFPTYEGVVKSIFDYDWARTGPAL